MSESEGESESERVSLRRNHPKSALRFTKYCTCPENCTSRLAKLAKCCICHEMCTSRVTECCACHEICKRATMSKSHDSPHLSRNPSSLTITAMSKSAAPAMKTAFRSKTAPIPCTRLPLQKWARRHNAHADFASLRSRNAL